MWGSAFVSLLITPFSYDPLNVSKFVALSIIGFCIFTLLLTNGGMFREIKFALIIRTTLFFIGWSFISILVTRDNFFQQIFGAAGRNTGFIAYASLVAVMLGTVFVSDKTFLEGANRLLIASGIVSLTYGLIQVFNFDPLNWTNTYSPVIGFLGNPNFQSSFMAITATSVFALSLNASEKFSKRFLYVIFIALALFSIYKSNSQQGYLVFGVGIIATLFLWLKSKSNSQFLITPYLVLAVGIFLATILDILQKAPWTSFLYKESVSNRGDMWRAGWRMTLDHPVFGVGFDNYGDWYRRYRDVDAISARGVDTISNTAHNVFLDISTSGGFPLLIAYLLILGLTIRAAFKLFIRTTDFNPYLTGVIGAWVAYMAQSLISINQIGLAIWGWVLSGAIIGYEIHTRSENQTSNRKNAGSFGTAVIGGFLGLIIGIPPFVSDLVYRNAIDSREVVRVENSAYQWPQNGDRMIQVAATLRDNKLNDQAIKVARDATKFAPERYEAWQVLASIPTLSDEERSNALIKMKELDPYNPNLK